VAVPEFISVFGPPLRHRTVSVTTLLRSWCRAAGLGQPLIELSVDGRPVSVATLRLLNSWIESGAAAHAARSGYFDAWRRLDGVLFDPPPTRVVRRRGKGVSKKKRANPVQPGVAPGAAVVA
jgi:hypothetical protein